MDAEAVRACLSLRWPDTEYLHVDEAPQEPSRGGRKLDRLVVALWPSRGLRLDGVEVKVSMSDWKRELKNAAKADWWWTHVHRFWVAAPADLADHIKHELPPTWGLLACERDKRPTVVVEAPFHDAAPLPWDATVGVLRAAQGCGVNALWRAEARGREQGRKQAEEEFQRRDPDETAKRRLEDLRERVRAFEEASGICVTEPYREPTELGRIVAIVRKEFWSPGYTLEGVTHAVQKLREVAGYANEIEKFALTIEQMAARALHPTTESPE